MKSQLHLGIVTTLLLVPRYALAWHVLAWSTRGVHEADTDFSAAAMTPPGVTLRAQVIDNLGHLVTQPGDLHVTYSAVADPDGSINRTSATKTNFWQFVKQLFGRDVAVDVGLEGTAMPGTQNQPQPMTFAAQDRSFVAAGIPLTPRDDAGALKRLPLFRVSARDASGTLLASVDVAVGVSDSPTCNTCHASESNPAARPLDGWVADADPLRDIWLNILRLHDDRELGNQAYLDALQTSSFDAAGLYATALRPQPILCGSCHASSGSGLAGLPGISTLSRAVHHRMASTYDPVTSMILDDPANVTKCERCHGSVGDHAVRSAMGRSTNPDGARAIRCQSCHGEIAAVAATERTPWSVEPACQSCHTGSAVQNAGGLRFTDVLDTNGMLRAPVTAQFATGAIGVTPAPLFETAREHGGLACAACHGSPHAEFPTFERNDNLRSMSQQGHPGALAECTSCHGSSPITVTGGPHGMHPVGAAWVQNHSDAAEGGGNACRQCHGADYRGTVLSRALGDRSLNTRFGQKAFFRGAIIGCYACHNGPNSESANPNHPAVVADTQQTATADGTALLALSASDADHNTLTLRVVDPPAHGTLVIDGTTATYRADAGFSGADRATYAAWDGAIDSNLATITINVPATCAGDCDSSGGVTIDELVLLVRVALGDADVSTCSAGDLNHDGIISIDEILRGVLATLNDCLP